jgi:hypothetical protein
MWLAKEQGGRIRFLPLPPEIVELANGYRYFHEAFDAVMEDYFLKDWKSVTERHLAGFYTPDENQIEVQMPPKVLREPESTPAFLGSLEAAFKSIPPKFQEALTTNLAATLAAFTSKNQPAFLAFAKSRKPKRENKTEKELTDAASSEKLRPDMKPQLPSLLERLNRATKETGKMSALADFLGKATRKHVPLASVSRWLSGKREPGGEITLMLLQWVEQQECQK